MPTRYHAPSDCPVCGDDLLIISKGCVTCGTELRGEFAGTEFDALDDAELAILRVFLTSRGNLRAVEQHLGVSYPTARSRFDALLAKLGLTPGAEEERDDQPAPQRAADWGDTEAAVGASEGSEAAPEATPHDDVLARVASGELSAVEAAAMLNER